MEDKDTKGLTGRSQGFNTIDIPGELESRTRRGITVAAGTVYDYGWDNGNEESQGAFQEHINRTLKTRIESINNTIDEVISPAVSEIPILEDKIDNSIPYTILYENQCVNIPCDANGKYTGDEEYIQTIVRLYHGNTVEPLSEQDGITPITQITGIEVIESSNREYATIVITRGNINNLEDSTEFNFKLKGESETIVNGKVIFNKVRQGKSSYQIWLDYKDENNQYPNAEKPVEAYLAYLRQSDFTTQGVLTRPADSDADTKTIYCIPNPEDENEWTEEIYDENISDWIILATHAGGLTSILEHLENLRVDVNEFKAQISKINRDLDRKLDKEEVDSAGLFLANEEGKVFMCYDNNGFDAEKVNQHFKNLVEPDLSDYAKKEDIPEQKTIIGDTEQDGIFFSDDEGNVFFKYDNENGIDAAKVSEHLKGLINPSSGSSSSDVIKDVDESGAFFVGKDGNAFAKYDNTEGFDVNKMSDHMKGLINKGGVPYITKINQTLSENSPIHLDTPDCKYNQTISFSGFIDNNVGIGQLVINRGNGENIAGNTSITIDSTNITVKSVTGDLTHNTPIPHGLTIKDFIIVNIKVGLFDSFSYLGSTITIITNDNTKLNGFKKDIIFRGSKLGVDATVSGEGVTLTNCSLSWSCSDLLKPLWCFGDSYFDYWPTRAARMGYGNAMYDGYSGRNSDDGMASLKKCLELGKPKSIFWCMGANDPDVATTANNPWDGESGTVNASWNTKYEELKTICAKHGIELILYTVHNGIQVGANYRLRLSLWKNDIIRNSGYRYIDVYDICKDPNKQIDRIENGHYVTDFFDDMNDPSDWTHPNIFGSNVIAHYIAANLPELKDVENYSVKDNISSLNTKITNLENNNN